MKNIEKEWFYAENLEKEQRLYKEGSLKANNQNDFISYNELLNGSNKSNIELHNATGSYAKCVALSVKKIKNNHIDRQIGKLADFGGGAGFIANEISKVFSRQTTIYSYDISEDAGKYGRKNFKNVTFITKGIETNENLKEGPFDIILAYEFYPFTRTSDWDYQKKYIDYCLSNINKDGILIIGVGNQGNNIYKNMKKIQEEYNVFIYKQPYGKIFKALKSYTLASIASKLLLNKYKHLLITITPKAI